MSNRLNAAEIKPHTINPLQVPKLGQTINNSQRQAAKAVEFGNAFGTLFRALAGVFLWMDRSIGDIQNLRIIFELNDRQLSNLGIKRSQIVTRCAEGWLP